MSEYRLSPLQDAIAGALSSLSANATSYPLDLIKTRMQVQSKVLSLKGDEVYHSQLDAFTKIIQSEGILGLYSGFTSDMMSTLTSSFAFFYCYSVVRGSYHRFAPGELSTASELAIGAIAGALSRSFSSPVTVITTRQQTSTIKPSPTFLAMLQDIITHGGITGLWRGLPASLVLTVNPSITYGLMSRLRSVYAEKYPNHKMSTLQVFILGAFTKAVATIVTYPLIISKIRLQWKPAPLPANATAEDKAMHEKLRYKNTFDVLRKIWEAEGILGWYKGLDSQLWKSVLTQALLFASKDYFERYTLAIFAALSQQTAAKRQKLST
ncbi:hypothetical protein SmJEL517_g02985 [Synchytrium microbalum]|uniref:Uncharacterized protein n=1 Tax=Synchytrium microbalum TaxID=1806994 RepID=A0A507C9Z7_9FUNG|nr:uncharacterized protein SmJEL517_g02985 [Synchytrium microbalum]TPX34325.1 hypothetical protein SmJEL517_g02985 [Synchytrium microbalum]